ncbi:FKBP-type peptidyl-prolyl cis-trans isomerase [Halomicrococcus sp. NG-SE-24]|uniref:FKBP-type peptidyl-prolyl cis-trans isomerase n=1 Tax=Halomicrococcus sp. NG-SE-24 TaxID=3436928 RepID=UPI003D970DF9
MVEAGRVAVVHYTGRLSNGDVFDTTDVDVALDSGVYHDHRDYKPLEFRVGEDKVIAGLDEAVRSMDVGEERTVELDPGDAFGEYSEERVVEMPRDELEERSDATAEEGDLVRSDTGDTGWIVDVGKESVTVDFNHELAGEAVELEIRVLEAHGGE